jgi:hypothetical protein
LCYGLTDRFAKGLAHKFVDRFTLRRGDLGRLLEKLVVETEDGHGIAYSVGNVPSCLFLPLSRG